MEDLLLTDIISDSAKACLGGLVVGIAFGALAQASRFCLRSACIEFWEGRLGQKVAVWLLVFGGALALVQLLFLTGALATTEVRQLETAGTLSGALFGGLTFGIGMILARGCASRLLVLSATGNLRAFVAGLVVTVAAQASLTGVLSPMRETISSVWIVGPAVRNLMLHLPAQAGLVAGIVILLFALWIARRSGLAMGVIPMSVGLGGVVALGWGFTAALSRVSFTPVAVGSVTFTGPSADTLMALITRPDIALDFSIGLVPGVFLGSLASALIRREFEWQAFTVETGTMRYLVGAAMMGFGGMLAGGCAVGAGITGGSVLSLTAWVALFFMWVGAGATHLVMKWLESPVGAAAAGR